MARPPALTSSDRSRARAKKFGRSHTKTQAPLKVTFTLRDVLAPSTTLVGSPHETRVIDARGNDVAQLKAGEKATFEAKEIAATDTAPKSFTWSRKAEPKAEAAAGGALTGSKTASA